MTSFFTRYFRYRGATLSTVLGLALALSPLLTGCERAIKPGETKPPTTQPTPTVASQPVQARKLPANAYLTLRQILPEPQLSLSASQPALPDRAEEPLRQAEVFYRADKLVEALEQVQTARRFAPDHPQVERLAALILAGMGNDAEASIAAKNALSVLPDSLALHYLVGRSFFLSNRDEPAIKEFRLALRSSEAKPENPKFPLTHLRLGMALERAGYWTAAGEEYEAFLTLTTRPPAEYFKDRELNAFLEANPALVPIQLGQLYLRLGDGAKAASAFYRAMMANTKSPEARQGYVLAMMLTGRRDDALASIAVLLSDFPDHRQTGPVILEAMPRLGEPGKVVADLSGLLTESSNPQAATEVLISVVAKAGRTDLAEAVLTAMLERNPGHIPTCFRLMKFKLEAKKPAGAFALLVNTVQADPLGALQLLDWMPQETAKMRELATIAEQETNNYPDRLEVQIAGAMVFQAVGEASQAERCLKRAEKIAPGSPAVQLLAVETQLASYHWQEALDRVEAIFKAGSSGKVAPARWHLLRGQAYMGLDQYDRAIQAYTQALNFSRKNAEALCLRGEAYQHNQEPRLAERDYRAALELQPNNGVTMEKLFELLVMQGDFESAETLVDKMSKSLRGSMAYRRVEAALALRQLLSSETTAPTAYQTCIRGLKELLNRAPAEGRTAFLLAQAQIQQGDYDQAATTLEAALKFAPQEEELTALLAEVRAVQGRWNDAMELYRTLLSRYPNRAKYQEKLAELYGYTERYAEARKLLYELLSKVDWSTLPKLAEGDENGKGRRQYFQTMIHSRQILDSYVAEGDFPAAEKQMTVWIKEMGEQPGKEPQKADDDEDHSPDESNPAMLGRAYLARLAMQVGRFDDAVRLMQILHQARPANVSYAYVYVQTLIRAGKFAEAAKLAGEGYDRHNDIRFVGLQAVAEYYQNGFDQADKLLGAARFTDQLTEDGVQDEKLAEKIAEQLQVAFLRLDLMEADKRYDQALELAEELAELPWQKFPGQNETEYQFYFQSEQIRTLRAAERYDEALQRMAEWAKESPQHFSDWQNLKNTVLAAKGDLPAADEALQTLVKQLDVFGTPTRWNHLIVKGMTELARALNNLGYAWADRGEHLPEAEAMIRRAVKLDAQNVAYNRLDRQGRPLEASDAYADSLGWVFYKKGDFGQALWWLIYSLQLGGQDATMYDHLGDAYYRLGYQKNARHAWQSARMMFERPLISSMLQRVGELDPKLKKRLQLKLKALDAGQAVPVAPTAGEQPATQKGK